MLYLVMFAGAEWFASLDEITAYTKAVDFELATGCHFEVVRVLLS